MARCLVAVLLVFAGCFPVAADEVADRVDKVFADYNKVDSPGCALGVIRDGKLIYKKGYGQANLEHGIPISSQSVFRIGSVSKQFAAAAMALLAEQGKISLDDDIRKHLPEIPDYGNPITIRRLIHHTSGLRDYLTLMSLAGRSDDDFYTDDDVVEMLARQKELNFDPGSEWLYSNSGYFLLSQIVKRAAGQSLGEYAAENIFQPLGMRNTHFHDDHTHIVQNRAAGYSPRDDGGFRINMTTLGMVGDGGVYTTIEDLLLWDRNFYENKLGRNGQALIGLLETPGKLNDGKALDYAFGLRVAEYRGLKTVGHGGSFVGFRAATLRFPEQKFSIAVLCNLSRTNPSRLARQVADVFLTGKLGEAPAREERRRGEGSEGATPVFNWTPKWYEGEYYSEELDVTYRVEYRADHLRFRHRNAPDEPFKSLGRHSFGVGNWKVLFEEPDKSGKSPGFTVQAGRVRNIRFNRRIAKED